MRRHHGITEQKEFLAELTEAYCDMNDFLLFNHGEPRTRELEVVQLMEEIWGKLP
jgi:hypothetical protein